MARPNLQVVQNYSSEGHPLGAPESLTIEDFSDVELLALVNDNADQDGWVTSQEMALAIGLDGKTATQCVGQRFSWLRRYGAIEKHTEKMSTWRLSGIGRAMVKGHLSKAEQRILENMGDDKLLSLARGVTTRYRATNATGAQLMRREWTYGTSKRRFQ